ILSSVISSFLLTQNWVFMPVNPVNVQASAQGRHFLTFDALVTYTASPPVTVVLDLGIFTRLAATARSFCAI
ncbi:MAG TPA: hypothetical protein VGO27_23270, partial [Candidatus Acidoferrum sp.]|nr:hypothetical protein [Candidatus Acidoferrum sp.]